MGCGASTTATAVKTAEPVGCDFAEFQACYQKQIGRDLTVAEEKSLRQRFATAQNHVFPTAIALARSAKSVAAFEVVNEAPEDKRARVAAEEAEAARVAAEQEEEARRVAAEEAEAARVAAEQQEAARVAAELKKKREAEEQAALEAEAERARERAREAAEQHVALKAEAERIAREQAEQEAARAAAEAEAAPAPAPALALDWDHVPRAAEREPSPRCASPVGWGNGGGYSPASCRSYGAASAASYGGGSCGGWSGGGWSGGGCFAGDGRVACGPRGEHTRLVAELQPGDGVYAPNLKREVEIVATTRSHESLICTVNGLRISRKHPVNLSPGCEESAWLEPQAISAVEQLPEPMLVHNFVLAEGGTMAVNGIAVVTLGPDTPSDHPYYGSSAVISDLQALPSWPTCDWAGAPCKTPPAAAGSARSGWSPGAGGRIGWSALAEREEARAISLLHKAAKRELRGKLAKATEARKLRDARSAAAAGA